MKACSVEKNHSSKYQKKFEIHFFYKTALYCAIQKVNLNIIKLLLNIDNVDVNLENIRTEKKLDGHHPWIKSNENDVVTKRTPLHFAVKRRYVGIIKLLLQNKSIDINIKDSQGKTPIEYATRNEIKDLFNL